MNERQLRAQCRRLLRELDIRPPLDVVDLCRRIGEHRGRPIRLVEYPLAIPGPFGLSFEADFEGDGRCDVIAYQKETSKWHQNHIILHELGHILADYDGGEDGEDDSGVADFEEIVTRLPFGSVRRRYRRTCYDSPHEREAELIATIIMEWAAALDGTPDPLAAELGESRYLRRSLSYRVGWL
jgi:hypothetical protein